jgi:SNF2 family DNA or RNA helicase
MGKTSVVLAAFEVLRKQRIVKKMLVIAPLRPAHSVWPGEAKLWKDFEHLKVAVLHGRDKEKLLRSDADIMAINPEGLPWLFRQKNLPKWEMLVVDESTRFKHSTTQRFKTLKPMLERFERRYILTGSPAPNGLLDLFGQIYILDFGNALGRYITHYRLNYFDNPRTGSEFDRYVWIPRPGAAEQIYKKLQPVAQRMAAEDYLELPELIFNKVEVELPPEARKHYDSMENLLLTSVEEGLVTAANAAAATNKCRQIANGGIYHEGGEEWTQIHDAKVDAVEEIIEELQGKPCLVSYEFRHDLDRLRRRLGDVPHIGGGVSTVRFREIEQAWNRGDIPVLVAQPQSVAHGLNLQGTGAAVIRMGLTWDLEVDEQFIRRVWRQGQKERVVVHSVVAKNTVDEVIMSMLRKKDKTQKALLGALSSHLRR